MARKTEDTSWLSFSQEQQTLLTHLDIIGNNGWGRNDQSNRMMPILLGQCAAAGLSMEVIKDTMRAIGYGPGALHQLDRWESKRTTGFFGK